MFQHVDPVRRWKQTADLSMFHFVAKFRSEVVQIMNCEMAKVNLHSRVKIVQRLQLLSSRAENNKLAHPGACKIAFAGFPRFQKQTKSNIMQCTISLQNTGKQTGICYGSSISIRSNNSHVMVKCPLFSSSKLCALPANHQPQAVSSDQVEKTEGYPSYCMIPIIVYHRC